MKESFTRVHKKDDIENEFLIIVQTLILSEILLSVD